jgi:transcriptional regulator with XRE-family HTH domain
MMKRKDEKKMTSAEIRKMLEDLNWSEARLADEADVTVYAVYKWLKDETHPTRLRARKIRAIRDKLLGKPKQEEAPA